MKKQEIIELAKQLRGRERNNIRTALEAWIDQAEKFKNAWFWDPPADAGSRRRYEEKNSLYFKGTNYFIKFGVDCSCRNIYIEKSITIHGYKLNLADAKKLVAILNKNQ